jgi:hypothetical protein
MKIYVAHSRGFDFKNELYSPIRQSELSKQNEIILPHEFSNASYSSKELFQNRKIDLLIAEVSYPATGLGIELGWANLLGVKIACIYKEDKVVSGSVKSISDKIISYNRDNLIEKLKSIINGGK